MLIHPLATGPQTIATLPPPTATSPGDALVYLLATQPEWTDNMQRAYAELRHQMGSDAALLVLQPDQRNLTVLHSRVTTSINRQDWQTATEQLRQVLSVSPHDPDANYQLGLILLSEDREQAAIHLDRVIILRPELASTIQQLQATQTNRELGMVLLDLQEWPFAERAFTFAIREDSQDWVSYVYRGYVRDQSGGNGRIDLETAVGLAPGAALPYYFLGLHWRGKDDNASYEAFATAYFLEPDNPALAAEVGEALHQLGNNHDAQSWFDAAVALAPDDLRWRRLQAAFYADNDFGLETGGLVKITAALERFPDDPHLLTSLGYAYYLLQQDQEAQQTLEQARALEPNAPRTHYYYGLTLQRRGLTQSAASAYYDAIALAGEATGYGYLAARALQQLTP